MKHLGLIIFINIYEVCMYTSSSFDQHESHRYLGRETFIAENKEAH